MSPTPHSQALPLKHGRGLRLVGEVDVSTVGALRAMLDGLPDDAGGVTLDLAELSFMDSTGLHTFELYARSLDGSGPLVLENASAHIRRVFEITGIDRNPNIAIRSDGDHG